jgi:Domain of unknown function (DUF5911)
MSFQPIENYGVIGNMGSTALVGINGSIDFLCYPDFDSPTVFAALLDDEKGGRFQIEPQLTNMRIRQLYLPETNILLTRFLAEEGVAELTDYMDIWPAHPYHLASWPVIAAGLHERDETQSAMEYPEPVSLPTPCRNVHCSVIRPPKALGNRDTLQFKSCKPRFFQAAVCCAIGCTSRWKQVSTSKIKPRTGTSFARGT